MTSKSLLLIGILFSGYSFSQTNTLPASGNVGIGTTTPTTRLQVNGSARIDSSLTVKDSITIQKSGHVKDKFTIDGKTVMKDDAVVRQNLKVDGNATVFGNLKLPQTASTPSYNGVLVLDSNGIVRSVEWSQVAVPPYNPPKLCADNNSGYTTPATQFWVSGPGKIWIPLTCNPDPLVGIGTEEPAAKLHIKMADSKRKSTKPFYIQSDNSLGYAFFNSSLEFVVQPLGGSEKPVMTIYGDFDYKILQLERSGLLRSREIKVDLDAWADFVFEPTYRLRPLSEVETYINENHHLPDVPSAKELCENGLNVAQTDAMLMQKVEELTLYMIQLQKQVEAQQQLIEVQQKQLDSLTKSTQNNSNGN